MYRHLTASLAIAVGAFLPTFTLLAPDAAEAKFRRVTAVTSCLPDYQTRDDWHTSGALFYSSTHPTATRSGTGLKMNLHTGDTMGVRCQVPTDSYLKHQNMTEAHVSGNKNAGNGFGSYVKACYTWYQNGSYSCGSSKTLASGNFNRVVSLGNIWNDGAAMPMITAVLANDDKLYGVFYTDQ